MSQFGDSVKSSVHVRPVEEKGVLVQLSVRAQHSHAGGHVAIEDDAPGGATHDSDARADSPRGLMTA